MYNFVGDIMNNYKEKITRNHNMILELRKEVEKLNDKNTAIKEYNINYNNTDLKKIIDEQNEYIDYLNSLIDMLYQSKINEHKKKIDDIIASGNINKDFYQLYNMGRFFYNNKYYPINNIYIKIYRSKDNINTVYQLLSTKKVEFSIFSNDNFNVNNYKYIKPIKFKDSSIFKKIYKDKRICRTFDIDINVEEKYKIFLEYLKNFDEKEYDFIKELSGEYYE